MRSPSKEVREKIRQSVLAHCTIPGYHEKLSLAIKTGQAAMSLTVKNEMRLKAQRTRAGYHHSESTKAKMRGKKHSVETKERLRQNSLGRKQSEDAKEKLRLVNLGRKHTSETKAKMCHPRFTPYPNTAIEKLRQLNLGRKHSDVDKVKMKQRRQELFKDPEFRARTIALLKLANIGKHLSVITKEKISKQVKKLWQNPEWVTMFFNAQHAKPNKCETELLKILQTVVPGEYRYVGDGQFILAGKCPDFLNINGQKKLIEFYGDYWHKDDDPQVRIDLFKKYGYDTLVIWERELMNDREMVLQRIVEFNVESSRC